MAEEEKGPSKTIVKAANRYIARMQKGEKMMRDSRGRVQWSDGQSVGSATLSYLMDKGVIAPLDTDLFGDASRGQSLGLAS